MRRLHEALVATSAWCTFWCVILTLEALLTVTIVWPLCSDPNFMPCQAYGLGIMPAPPMAAVEVASFAIVLLADRYDIAVACVSALHIVLAVQIGTLVRHSRNGEWLLP